MGSGNFLIGDKGLSLQGFNQYVQQPLEKQGIYVKDKLAVDHEHENSQKILVSIVGAGDLEKTINDLLVKTGEILEEEVNKKGVSGCVAHSFQISKYTHHEKINGKDVPISKGIYEVLGVYQDDATASKLFPALAQSYLLDAVEKKADEVAETLKEFLDTKIRDV